MQKFKVIKSEKISYKPNAKIYAEAAYRLMDRSDLMFTSIDELAERYPDQFKRYLFLQVKLVGLLEREYINDTTIEDAFTLFSAVVQLFQYITPVELQQMFPIEKDYSGNGDWKDYFTTMGALGRYAADEPLGTEEAVLELLMDYQNWDTNHFMVNWMCVISRMSVFMGNEDPAEKFLSDIGVPTYTYHEKEGYLYSRQTGEVSKIQKAKKRIPKYLKVVD